MSEPQVPPPAAGPDEPGEILLARAGTRLTLAIPSTGGKVRVHPLSLEASVPRGLHLALEEGGGRARRSFPFGEGGDPWPEVEVTERPGGVRIVGSDDGLGVLMWVELHTPFHRSDLLLSTLPVLRLEVGTALMHGREGFAGRMFVGLGSAGAEEEPELAGMAGAVGSVWSGSTEPGDLEQVLPPGWDPPDEPVPWRMGWLPLSGKWLQAGWDVTCPVALNASSEWDRVGAELLLCAAVEGPAARDPGQGGAAAPLAGGRWSDLDRVAADALRNAGALKEARDLPGPLRGRAVQRALSEAWWLEAERFAWREEGHAPVAASTEAGWLGPDGRILPYEPAGGPSAGGGDAPADGTETDPSHRRRLW